MLFVPQMNIIFAISTSNIYLFIIYLFILPRNWNFHPRMAIHAVVSMITEENIGYHILNTKHTYHTMIQQTALRKA